MPSLHFDDPVVVGAGFIPARAKSIPCFSASKRRMLNEMKWSVSRPRSATPDSGGDKPLPYEELNSMKGFERAGSGFTETGIPRPSRGAAKDV